jgi:hypothetical protein
MSVLSSDHALWRNLSSCLRLDETAIDKRFPMQATCANDRHRRLVEGPTSPTTRMIDI